MTSPRRTPSHRIPKPDDENGAQDTQVTLDQEDSLSMQKRKQQEVSPDFVYDPIRDKRHDLKGFGPKKEKRS